MPPRYFIVLSAIALFAATSVSASAQNAGPDQEKGSTGWSGGSKDQVGQNTAKVEVHDDDKAQYQPLTATGLDLKGPANRFAPSKTPE